MTIDKIDKYRKLAITVTIGTIILVLIVLVIYIFFTPDKGDLSNDTKQALRTLTPGQKAGIEELTEEQKTALREVTQKAAELTGQTVEQRLDDLKHGRNPGGFVSGMRGWIVGDLDPSITWGWEPNAELWANGLTPPDGIPVEMQKPVYYTPGSVNDPYLQQINSLYDSGEYNPELAAKYGVILPGYNPNPPATLWGQIF